MEVRRPATHLWFCRVILGLELSGPSPSLSLFYQMERNHPLAQRWAKRGIKRDGGRELGNGQREGTRQVCLSFLEGISYFAEVPRAPQTVLSQYLLDKRVDF